ncbi:MAG: hypothetical protein ACI9XK_003887 [Granulosicoccus sp.]|jgi:hypothetical protein
MQIERMKLTNRKSATTARVPFSSVAVLVTLLVGQPAFAAGGDVYKTVDEDGTITFTDKRKSNSTAVAPIELNILAAPLPALNGQSTDIGTDEGSEPADPSPITVNSVKITSPQNEQTLINPRGSILIGIKTGPENGMPDGYTAEIKMNGKVVSSGGGTLLSMPVPDRGTHTIAAIILDSVGTVQASSQTVTFHVMKTFVRKEE